MLSIWLGVIGLGAIGLGLGLLVQGPLALDRRPHRLRSDSGWALGPDALDLHADRRLGELDAPVDELWRPFTSPHFFTLGAIATGLCGLLLLPFALPLPAEIGLALAAGVVLGWVGARGLRALPPRPRG